METIKTYLSEFLYEDVIGIITQFIIPIYKNEKKISELRIDFLLKYIIGIDDNAIYITQHYGLTEYAFNGTRRCLLRGGFIWGLYLNLTDHFVLYDSIKNCICIFDKFIIIKEISCSYNCVIGNDDDYIYLINYNGNITKLSYNYEIIENTKFENIFKEYYDMVSNICNGIIYISDMNTTNTIIIDTKNKKIITDKIFGFIESNMVWYYCKIYKGITSKNIFVHNNNKVVVYDRNYKKIRETTLNIEKCKGIIVFTKYILIIDTYKVHILEKYEI